MKVKWKIVPLADGSYEGIIEIPLHPGVIPGGGKIAANAKGGTKATALGKAAVIAQQMTDALEKHPALAAIVPPGTTTALAATKAIAKSAAAGKVEAALRSFTGPAVKRLAKALHL